MYQYLSWFHRGKTYPSGNKLLSIDSVNKLKSALLGSGVEVHESVQRYTSLGAVMFTPVYADFDSEDSVSDIGKFVANVETEFKLTPDIYYSGNRGFHTFINIPVSHAYPHLVVKKFMEVMCGSRYMDTQMYSSRHLLRSEGSIHFKSNLYKTRVSLSDMSDLKKIKSMSNKALVSESTHHESRPLELFLNGLYHIVDKEVAEAEEKYKLAQSDSKGEVSPCIKSLINNGPVTGQNNSIITLIARNMNAAGIGIDEATHELMSNPKWSSKSAEIKATLKSIYKSPSRFGCKGNDTLRQYCDPFCPFNEEHINII